MSTVHKPDYDSGHRPTRGIAAHARDLVRIAKRLSETRFFRRREKFTNLIAETGELWFHGWNVVTWQPNWFASALMFMRRVKPCLKGWSTVGRGAKRLLRVTLRWKRKR